MVFNYLSIESTKYNKIINNPFSINLNHFRTIVGRITSSSTIVSDNNESSIIRFHCIKFTSEQGAVLSSSALLQTNVQLLLENCEFDDNGIAFAAGLRNNNGPNQLYISGAYVPTNLFFSNVCNGIANTSSTKLKELRCSFILSKKSFTLLCAMLRTNSGLNSLFLYNNDVTTEKHLFQSLHNHPTLEKLEIQAYEKSLFDTSFKLRTISYEMQIQITEPVIELLQHNTILKEIILYSNQSYDERGCYYNDKLIEMEIEPHLIINRNRLQILQISTSGTNNNNNNDKCRSRLIGEFLANSRHNLSLIWLLVRDNHKLVIDNLQN